MEFECKRLEQRLETLKREKTLKSWTEHNNEFGTVITIRCTHGKMASIISETQATSGSSSTTESLPASTEKQTNDDSSQFAANVNRATETHATIESTDCFAGSYTESGSTVTSKQVFKPVSQYQMRRDQERRDAYRNRCTTRSRASQQRNVHEQSMELNRSRDLNESVLSNTCISPVTIAASVQSPTQSNEQSQCILESPWADSNRYSCLDVDSPDSVQDTSSTNADNELYGAPDSAVSDALPKPDPPDPPPNEEATPAGAESEPEPEPDMETPEERHTRLMTGLALSVAEAMSEAMRMHYEESNLASDIAESISKVMNMNDEDSN